MSYDNTINRITQYLAELYDEKYKMESVTEMLDAPDEIVQETQAPRTIQIPRHEIDGLNDYDRNSGFSKGGADVLWESHELTVDRGRQFMIDRYDDIETLEVAFGRLTEEFMRTQVVPEIDAYRFAEMADKAENSDSGSLDNTDTMEAIDTADETLTEAEVPPEGRILFVNPTIKKHLKQSNVLEPWFDVQTGEQVVDRRFFNLDGNLVIVVPKARFNDNITLKDDSDGGFDTAGETINFMMVHPTAVLSIVKHRQPRIFGPDENQSADGYLYDYRVYHDIFAPENKTEGIYVHTES